MQAPLVGTDGVFSVSSVMTLNEYAVLATSVSAGATSAVVTDVAQLDSALFGPIASGDLVMLIQMQGASIATTDDPGYGAVTNLNQAGAHELVELSSVDRANNRLVFTGCGLKNAYTTAGKTQVVRVPQFTSLTISQGTGTVTALPWDGARGGVVALHVSGTLNLQGTIDVSGQGFRGGAIDTAGLTTLSADVSGYRTGDNLLGGARGEGIAGGPTTYDGLGGRFGRGAAANAGGGGNAVFAGGGGGANGNKGGTWAGQGVMDPSAIGATAWRLDPGRDAGTVTATPTSDNPGGGRGGYSYSLVNLNATSSAPGAAGWQGNLRRERGGLGGRPLDGSALDRLFLGGGGGAGDGENGTASPGAGGNGGGLIYILADTVSGAGGLVANGGNGGDTSAPHHAGAGGGGAGGTVVVRANSLSGFNISANGGNGGKHLIDPGDDAAAGPGGGGGGGYIAVTGGSPSRDAVGGLSGESKSNALTEFPVNGATRGASGVSTAGITAITSTLVQDVPLCLGPADLRVTLTDGQTSTVPGSSVAYTLVVTNVGPGVATGARVIDTLPGSLQNVTWTCSSTAPNGCAVNNGTGNVNRLTTLGANESVTYSISATVSATATGTLTNQASITPPPITSDPVLTNNVAVDADTLTPRPDLQVSIDAPPSFGENSTASYTVTVTNAGLSQATTVKVTFQLAPELPYLSASGAGWTCTHSGQTVTCTAGSIAPGASSSFTVVGSTGASSGFSVTSSASAVSNQSDANAADANPADNSATSVRPIEATNDAPVNFLPLTAVTNEDTSVSVASSVVDIDIGTSPIYVTLTATNGRVTLTNRTGLTFDQGTGAGQGEPIVAFHATLQAASAALTTLTFTPNQDFNGVTTLRMHSNDMGATGAGGPKEDDDVCNITVIPVNDPPTLADDNATLPEDSVAFVLDVLDNDTIAPDTNETLTITQVSAPPHGSVSLGSNGTRQVILYTPTHDFFGADAFTYTVSDGNGGSATATVHLTVTNVNDPPTANDDSYGVVAGAPEAGFNVLANDSIAPDTGETLSITAISTTNTGKGTVSFTAAQVRYRANASATGTDSFSYTISDGNGGTAVGQVTVTIGAANQPPENHVPDGGQTTPEDTPLVFSQATNNRLFVTDPDAADAGVQVTLTASPGTLSVRLDAGVGFALGDGTDDATMILTGPLPVINAALATTTYLPPADYNGPASLTVLSNGLGNTGVDGPKTDSDTIAITVTPVNDPPIATDDTVSVSEDSLDFIIAVLINDSVGPDPGDTLSVSSVTAPLHGTARASADGLQVLYTPARDYFGPDALSYTISDGHGGTATAQVTITVVNANDPPTANADLFTVTQDSVDDVLDVLANDSTLPDPPGETLALVSFSQPLHGTVRANTTADRALYTPTPGFYGIDTFNYVVQDSSGGISSGAVKVVVGADTDLDGLSDGEEAQLGTDPNDPDSDGDGLPDGVEFNLAMTDPLDDDTDDDGLLDGAEDVSLDGVVDPQETSPTRFDTDGDGLSDGLERGLTMPQGHDTNGALFRADADPSTVTSPILSDTDHGGVPDGQEDLNQNGRIDADETDPNDRSDDRIDSDHDGLTDSEELAAGTNPNDADSDEDGVLDGADGITDTDADGRIDALDEDSDDDGLFDGTEAGVSEALRPVATDASVGHFIADADPTTVTNPRVKDTDGDGLTDGNEDLNHDGRYDPGETDATRPDTDGDALSDFIELTGATRTNPEQADTDGDGLTDGEEDLNHDGNLDEGETNPTLPDTDFGGRTDKEERDAHTNPRDPSDDFSVGGGAGCSTSGGPLLGLLALGLLGLKRRRAAMLAALLLVVPLARADTAGKGLDVMRYQPGMGARDWLDFESARVPEHLQLSVRLSGGYALSPLVLRVPNSNTVADRVVDSLTFFNLTGGIGLSNRFEITAGLPVSVLRAGDASTVNPAFQPSSAFGAGDLRLGVKYSVFAPENAFQLGFSLPIWFPTGSAQSWRGGGPVGFAPRAIAELSIPQLHVGAAVGFNFRTANVSFLDLTVGQEFAWNAGAQIPVIGDQVKVSVMGTVNGVVGLTSPSIQSSPITAMLGLRLTLFERLYIDASGGAGLTRGYGAPNAQVVAAIGYVAPPIKLAPKEVVATTEGERAAQTVRATTSDAPAKDAPIAVETERFEFDSDGDGVPDGADTCPTSKETINGIKDGDGCADTGVGAFINERGTWKQKQGVGFRPGTAELTAEGESTLTQLALILKANRNLRAHLEVFVTERPTREENNVLSAARARAIHDALVIGGVAKRASIKSMAMQRPLDPSNVEVTFQ